MQDFSLLSDRFSTAFPLIWVPFDAGGTVVKFTSEEGVDAGGLSREMWTLLRQQLFRPGEDDGCFFIGATFH